MQGFETKERQLLSDVLNVSLEKPFQAEKGLKSPNSPEDKMHLHQDFNKSGKQRNAILDNIRRDKIVSCILQSLHIFINFLVLFSGNSHFKEVNAKLMNYFSKSLCNENIEGCQIVV